MEKWILFSVGLLILAPVCTQAEQSKIYKSTDADGQVTYSDVPSGHSQTVILGQPLTYRPQTTPPGPGPASNIDVAPRDYQTLAITSPLADQVIRSNSGNLSIEVNLAPTLSADHKITLFIDGKASTTSLVNQSGVWICTLTNLDRGQHQFQVKIISATNKNTIIVSAPVTATILRYSRLHQRK